MTTTKRNLRAVTNEPERERPPDLRDAVAESIDAMEWLQPSDSALKALARRVAAEIEQAVERAAEFEALQREAAGDESLHKRLKALEAQCDATKAVGWLGPQLQGYLRDLGGTPTARKAFAPDAPVGSRLAQLRSAAPGANSR